MATRITQSMLEVLAKVRPHARLSEALLEYIADIANRDLRTSELIIECIFDVESRDLRVSQLIIEVPHPRPKSDGYTDECSEGDFAW